MVLTGRPPRVSLSGGSYYYPGSSITASGAGWTVGSGNVVPVWDGGAALDSSGATLTADEFSGYSFSVPTTAMSGRHTLTFVRTGGASVDVSITVQQPSSMTLSAGSTDISAGGSTSITATVFDQGQQAANAAA